MKLPEGWTLRTVEYTMRGIRFEVELTHAARTELVNAGYQSLEVSLPEEARAPGSVELFDAINKMLGFDMDPVGTVQWWGTQNRFVGDVAWNTPLEALKAGTLRVDQVLEEMEYTERQMG